MHKNAEITSCEILVEEKLYPWNTKLCAFRYLISTWSRNQVSGSTQPRVTKYHSEVLKSNSNILVENKFFSKTTLLQKEPFLHYLIPRSKFVC